MPINARLSLLLCTTTLACFDLGTPPPEPICGDGTIDVGEECDDGNNANADGCDAACQSELISCDAGVMSQAAADFCNEALREQVNPADCQDTGPAPVNFCDVKLRTEVMPILAAPQTCGNTASCHGNAINPPQGFKVDANDVPLTLLNLFAASTQFDAADPNLLNRVEASDPARSYLMHKLIGTQQDVGGLGVRMPFLQDRLCPDDIAAVCFWIAAGAPDN